MTSEYGFCDECKEEVRFVIRDVPISWIENGNTFMRLEREAYCSRCGSRVLTPVKMMMKNHNDCY